MVPALSNSREQSSLATKQYQKFNVDFPQGLKRLNCVAPGMKLFGIILIIVLVLLPLAWRLNTYHSPC